MFNNLVKIINKNYQNKKCIKNRVLMIIFLINQIVKSNQIIKSYKNPCDQIALFNQTKKINRINPKINLKINKVKFSRTN